MGPGIIIFMLLNMLAVDYVECGAGTGDRAPSEFCEK
jgi:hypothetical protein